MCSKPEQPIKFHNAEVRSRNSYWLLLRFALFKVAIVWENQYAIVWVHQLLVYRNAVMSLDVNWKDTSLPMLLPAQNSHLYFGKVNSRQISKYVVEV